MDGHFISQMRSWDIMRKYFGVEQPGTTYIPIKWPLVISKEEEKKMIEAEKKRIQLN